MYHLPDPIIIVISATGNLLRCIVFLLSTDKDNLYIGAFLDMFNLAGIVSCR